jgi:hypothetical protein
MTMNAWSAEAYNSSDFDQSITNLANIGANWVTLTVFWFMNTSSDTEMHPRPDLYTASDSSLTHAIQKAHELGMEVSLKPMVDVVDGTWRGQISPSNWTLWFVNYRGFINYYANFSQVNSVKLFTVGTELRSSQSHESEWREVINETRARFSGNVTYAANWDSYSIYQHVPLYGYAAVNFWDALDYVGVDGYFPLTNSYSPTVAQLVNAWSYSTASGWWGTGYNWTNELYLTYNNTGKRILFTEIGYTSQNGTNTQPWTYVPPPTGIDLQEQADCYQACLEVFKDKAWFMGWFWWDWETDPTAGGSSNTDYTPQNKPAQSILNQYYSTRTVTFQATGTGVPVTVNYTRATGNYATAGSLTIPVAASNSIVIPYASNVSFSYASPVDGGSGIRYAFGSTNATSPIANVVNDTTVIGQYSTQYLLTVLTAPPGLNPQPTRNPQGEAGPTNCWWYNASADVTLTAQTVTRYTFNYWDIDGSSQGAGVDPVTVTMNASHTATTHYAAYIHDTALTNITLPKNVIGQGFSLNLTVTAENQGDYDETFNVTAYANATGIGSDNITLPSGNSTTATFTWNTTSFAYGNYTLSAYAWPVIGETNTANNNFTGGTVGVTIPGDVNGDGTVNILDAIQVSNSFLATPGSSNWNPNADINCDNVVNILDAILLANHFLQHYP